jgi:hypothetical protein
VSAERAFRSPPRFFFRGLGNTRVYLYEKYVREVHPRAQRRAARFVFGGVGNTRVYLYEKYVREFIPGGMVLSHECPELLSPSVIR